MSLQVLITALSVQSGSLSSSNIAVYSAPSPTASVQVDNVMGDMMDDVGALFKGISGHAPLSPLLYPEFHIYRSQFYPLTA